MDVTQTQRAASFVTRTSVLIVGLASVVFHWALHRNLEWVGIVSSAVGIISAAVFFEFTDPEDFK